MNVDQSTHAIPLICTCKKSKWIFLAKPMKCPLYFCVLYFTMIEVEKMKLVWVGSVDIYFVNVGSKVIASRKYKKNLITCNSLIVGLMDSVL